jgi:hypothetical protein
LVDASLRAASSSGVRNTDIMSARIAIITLGAVEARHSSADVGVGAFALVANIGSARIVVVAKLVSALTRVAHVEVLASVGVQVTLANGALVDTGAVRVLSAHAIRRSRGLRRSGRRSGGGGKATRVVALDTGSSLGRARRGDARIVTCARLIARSLAHSLRRHEVVLALAVRQAHGLVASTR